MTPVRRAFEAYREAVLAEAAARTAHYAPKRGSKVGTDQALLQALGRVGETRAALDEEILKAHGLTPQKP